MRRPDDVTAEVQLTEKREILNMVERTCSCRKWQVNRLSCIHAAKGDWDYEEARLELTCR